LYLNANIFSVLLSSILLYDNIFNVCAFFSCFEPAFQVVLEVFPVHGVFMFGVVFQVLFGLSFVIFFSCFVGEFIMSVLTCLFQIKDITKTAHHQKNRIIHHTIRVAFVFILIFYVFYD